MKMDMKLSENLQFFGMPPKRKKEEMGIALKEALDEEGDAYVMPIGVLVAAIALLVNCAQAQIFTIVQEKNKRRINSWK